MSATISTKNKGELKRIAALGLTLRTALLVTSTPLTPVNFTEEMEKFFRSKKYNPQFKYQETVLKRYDKAIDELEQRIESLDLPVDLFSYLIDYLSHLRLLYHARRSIGKPAFATYAELLFNWNVIPPEEVLKEIPKIHFKNEKRGTLRGAEEIKEQLQSSIDNKYNIPHFTVKINNFSRNLVFVNLETIYIGRDIKRFQNNVDRLVAHEVESHLIQNYNMRLMKNPLLFLSRHSTSELYSEGLAVYNEIKSETITEKSYLNYFYRLKAVNNIHLSFRELYELLLSEGLTVKLASNIAYRMKRGMGDTGRPGGFPKDAAYFMGYKAVLDFLKNHPEKIMYYTKNPHLTKLLMKYELVNFKEPMLPKFYTP